MWAVVPVKRFDRAKQRLTDALAADARELLAIAMLEDVLEALTQVPELAGVLLVSREPRVHALATRYGAQVFSETGDEGLCDALTQAAHHLEAKAVGGMLIVPGDVPLLRGEQLSALLREHTQVTIVPDRNDDGTNCLIVSPPTAIEFRFGIASANAHRDAARERGIEPRVVALPELGLDIDNADDLREFEGRVGAAHTRKVLQDAGAANGGQGSPFSWDSRGPPGSEFPRRSG